MDMDKEIAIVTGASSGIGAAIAEMLLNLGYEVYGFGRHFPAETESTAESRDTAESGHDEAAPTAAPGSTKARGVFHPVVCDLLDTNRVLQEIRAIEKQGRLMVLVNNAGVAYYGLHEELNPRKIQEMLRTNLELPLILTQALLRTLKKNHGAVVNISSVTALSSNPHGACYGAAKAGLSSFSRSLFDEARKYGLRVISILPDMTDTALYRNADFTVGEEAESRLDPAEVAEAVRYALTARPGLVVHEIVLRPQLHRIKRR